MNAWRFVLVTRVYFCSSRDSLGGPLCCPYTFTCVRALLRYFRGSLLLSDRLAAAAAAPSCSRKKYRRIEKKNTNDVGRKKIKIVFFIYRYVCRRQENNRNCILPHTHSNNTIISAQSQTSRTAFRKFRVCFGFFRFFPPCVTRKTSRIVSRPARSTFAHVYERLFRIPKTGFNNNDINIFYTILRVMWCTTTMYGRRTFVVCTYHPYDERKRKTYNINFIFTGHRFRYPMRFVYLLHHLHAYNSEDVLLPHRIHT